MRYAAFAPGMRLRALLVCLASSTLACGDPAEHGGELPLGTAGSRDAAGTAGASGGPAATGGVVASAGASGVAVLVAGAGAGGSPGLGGFNAFGGTAGMSALGGSPAGSGVGATAAEPVPDASFDAAWAVFKSRCGECHGDSAERFGGQDRQKAFTAALIYADEIARRIALDRTSRDAMPPRRALGDGERVTLQTWLASL
jgi:mono/diheme cytochrome c family protein